jgi:hypothetical protein
MADRGAKKGPPRAPNAVEAVLKLSFSTVLREFARAVETNGNFAFYAGDNFSGDDGTTDYATDI